MHYSDAVYVSGGELVERHDVFGVMIFYLQEICYLTVGLLRQLAADLDIDALVAPHGYEIYLPALILAYIHLIAAPPQLEVHDVFQH